MLFLPSLRVKLAMMVNLWQFVKVVYADFATCVCKFRYMHFYLRRWVQVWWWKKQLLWLC